MSKTLESSNIVAIIVQGYYAITSLPLADKNMQGK